MSARTASGALPIIGLRYVIMFQSISHSRSWIISIIVNIVVAKANTSWEELKRGRYGSCVPRSIERQLLWVCHSPRDNNDVKGVHILRAIYELESNCEQRHPVQYHDNRLLGSGN
jgi:hypothetical protein